MNAIPETLPQKIRAKYEVFGVPTTHIPTSRTTHAELLQILETIAPQIPNMPCQVVPTSFNPDDPQLRAFPRPLKWRWDSCERMFRAFKTSGVLMRLPLFWQVEPALFAAGQAAGAPIFVNDQENMPVGAEAIRIANMDTVVTDSQDAVRFSSYLSGAKTQFPASWIIVHPVSLDVWDIPAPAREEGTHVAQEVHLFPGVTLLEQCESLAEKKEPVFHASDAFQIETENSRTYVTSVTDEPFPLLRYELALSIVAKETCSCGKPEYTRA